MKKPLLLPFFILLSSLILANYTIKGTISDYPNKTVIIRQAKGVIYDDLATLTTDSKGRFSYKVKENFDGLLLLSIKANNNRLLLLANGKNINFQTTVESIGTPIFQKNSINDVFQSYVRIKNKDNTNKILDYILNLYSPDDAYYKATMIEKNRLSGMSFDNHLIEKYPLINFYIKGKEDINRYGQIREELAAKAEREDIIQKIKSSGEYLESTNLLGDYVSSFFILGNYVYKSRAEIRKNMKKDLDKLLNEVGIETNRGQLVLTRVLDLLKGYGFKNIAEQYVAQIEKESCKILPFLADKIASFDAIKIGKTLPDSKLPNGQTIHQMKSKYKVVLFWSPTCSHCLKDYPNIVKDYPILKQKGGELIAFGADTDQKKYNELTKGKKWINIYDKGESFLEKYGIEAFPTFVLLDKNNIVKGTYVKMDLLMKDLH